MTLGLRVAVFTCFGVVVACSVYDETLLPVGSLTGGGGSAGNGSVGTGGIPASGGSMAGTGGATGNGGAIDSSIPVADSSQGGGGTGGSSVADSSPDVVIGRDVVDSAVADRSDVSVTPPGCPLLIDNMESGLGQINDGCRNGFWFTFSDGTAGGTIAPATGTMFTPTRLSTARTATSMWAAHVSGSGFMSAGMGVNFNAPPTVARSPYNASAYIGVTFWAIGSGTAVSFSAPNRDTDPAGGICADGGRGGCFDHFQTPITLNVATWTQYTVLFSSLRQKGFGYVPPGGFDKSTVYGIQWGVTAGGAFDFWIDDVSFITADGG